MTPADFFVLRTPLLPFDSLAGLSEDLEAPAATSDPARLPDAWNRDLARVRRQLRTLVQMPVVREALFVASPDVDRALDGWLHRTDEAAVDRLDGAVLKYVARMAARATPFGLFAGCGVGERGERTRLELAPRAACRRHTRLDMDYLVLLADRLARAPAMAATIRYSPNSSLYRLGDRWRYVETRWRGRDRTQHLVAVDDTTALAAVVERAQGAVSRADLVAALVDDSVTVEEGEAFIDDLIESQVLVPDLECPVTGDEPLAQLVALLRRDAGGMAVANALAMVGLELDRIDAAGLGAAPSQYADITRRLEMLPAPVDAARLFQVDLVRPAPGATLDRSLAADIVCGADVLRRLRPSGQRDELDAFRAAFAERYEQRPVSLLEALDEESGVGAALVESGQRDASPLLRGLRFPVSTVSSVPWGTREARLLCRVGEVLLAGGRELALTSDDIAAMDTGDAPALPDAFSVQATLVAASTADVGAECRVLLHSVSGPSGARLLGRFCHADSALTARVARHLREEESRDPEALFAEVVHLPEGRLGNILLRPVLRDMEITYLGRSGAPAEHQLPVTDLTLRLVDGRFELRSKRLGRRIVPRLTSAHNFSGLTLNLYRLLCLLQGQGRLPGCAWDWGPLVDLPFLPRVTFGRLVFARATWRVHRDEVRAWCACGDGAAQYGGVQRWRATRRIDRWVVLADHDNTLAIDLDNALSVQVLIRLLQDRESATLTELYPGPDDLCVKGEDGRYVHELLIPCVAQPPSRDGPHPPTSPVVTRPRVFAPGSEWVFAKLYTGTATADRALAQVIGPVSRRLLARGLIDRWFFVRYSDPDQHLRWRLHAVDADVVAAVQAQLERAIDAAMAERLVRRLAFDTYEREVERYGGDAGIAAAEHWFWADSEAVIDLLDHCSVSDDPDLRWRLGLVGVDALLADLGFDFEARLLQARERRAAFGREFRAGADLGRQLAARFRDARPALERMIAKEPRDASAPWRTTLASRTSRSRQPFVTLYAAAKAGTLGVRGPDLAASFAHMHLNRLFRDEQRAHELVVYDFLTCLYSARLARMRLAALVSAAPTRAPSLG